MGNSTFMFKAILYLVKRTELHFMCDLGCLLRKETLKSKGALIFISWSLFLLYLWYFHRNLLQKRFFSSAFISIHVFCCWPVWDRYFRNFVFFWPSQTGHGLKLFWLSDLSFGPVLILDLSGRGEFALKNIYFACLF